MNHDYNTRSNINNNKQEPVMNGNALAKLEHNISTNINSLRA